MWTREQEQAIEARNHCTLVSAAAGSGKTTVLVERVVRLVRDGAHVDRMLIVTFTRAAAGEMRKRLNEKFVKEAAKDPETFGPALDELENTSISTIHAFCQSVLKSNFQNVGIDPLARICEENQRQQLFEVAYRETVNGLLEEKDGEDAENVRVLFDAFHQREIRRMAEELYTFLMSMPNPMDWLHEKTEQIDDEPIREQAWYQTLANSAGIELAGAQQYLDAQERMFGEKNAVGTLNATWQKDCQVIAELAEKVDDAEAFLAALAGVKFATAARTTGLTEEETEWKESYNALRKRVKETVENVKKRLLIDEARTAADLKQIKKCLCGLRALMERLHTVFMRQKNEACVIDFNDLEQMTLQILQQEDLRGMLQRQYDHIFVDECQDVSAVQDAIIQLLHGPDCCLFMVGDVKQSIYRFRLADPTLFQYRMRTYSDDPGARERRIFLQRNFRSRANVLDATNRVFRSAMQATITELDYLPEDELIPGRETQNDPPVEIRLVKREEKDGAAGCLESEAAAVARRIRALLETTRDTGEGLYQYRDMVILLSRTAGIGARLAELLEDQGIPVYFDGKDDYYGLPEVRTVCELLRVIDNPRSDVALLTVLKMMPFRLTDSDLAAIRLCRTGKDVPFHVAFEAACQEEGDTGDACRAIRDTLEEWRFRKESMRLSDFVWSVVRETGFYAACGAYPEGELRQANLRLLCQRAAEYERTFDGVLSGFLRMVDQQMRAADATGAKVLGENENLVRIMTMHKSKGLEFPVVFLMRLTAEMMGRGQGTLSMHGKLGVCLPYVNSAVNVRRAAPMDEAFSYRRRLDEMAERCRLLYVAMTRARERLILTGCCAELERLNWRLPRSPYRVWSARSMMDWVMQAVLDDAGDAWTGDELACGPWRVCREEEETIEKRAARDRSREIMEWAIDLAKTPPLRMPPWWEGIGQPRQVQPVKTSVSSLTRREVLGDQLPLEEEERVEDKRAAETIVMPLRLSELPAKPAFMEEKTATGAERGTLMHRFLSLMPLENVRGKTGHALTEAVYAELGTLIRRGCFDEAAAGLMDAQRLTAWFGSLLGQRMLASDYVRREWAFNLRIDEENGTLLQGVIDCAFLEDGGWVLVDYKTDRIDSEEAFIMRHAAQLNWYAEALERITGKPVREMWLYALGKNRAYPVERRGQDGGCFT